MLSLRRKRVVFSALAVAFLAVPVSALAINKISSTEDTHAATMPAGFADQNFYDCVLTEFQSEFPDETVATTGLTDEQLAKIARLICDGSDRSDSEKISNTLGIEKMSSLKMIVLSHNNITEMNLGYNLADLVTLYINGNSGLTFLDLSGNPALANLHVDNIFIRTTLINPKSVLPNVEYDLSGVKFLKNTNQTETVGETDDLYDWDTGILTIGNYNHSYVQVSADNDIYNFKLQLPLFMELNNNNGTGDIIFPMCYTVAGDEKCLTKIPEIGLPVKDGYNLKGYADSSSSMEANYALGDSVELSAPKTVYAVWEENHEEEDNGLVNQDKSDNKSDDKDGDKDGTEAGNKNDGNNKKKSGDEENVVVPSTSSTGKPNTGENTDKDGDGGVALIQVVPIILLGGIVVCRRHFGKNRHRKFEW